MNAFELWFYARLIRIMAFLKTYALAIAKDAPVRNHRLIEVLNRESDEYQRELTRLELGL